MKFGSIISVCLLETAVALINCSCTSASSDKTIETFTTFPVELTLEHSVIHTPPVLWSVGDMLLLDSVLITVDFKADTFFRIFNVNDFSYIGASIIKGGGPSDELYIAPCIKKLDANNFLYNALFAQKIKYAHFDVNTKSVQVYKTLNYPKKVFDFQQVFQTGDAILGISLFSKKQYYGISATNEILDFGDYPDIGKKIKQADKYHLFFNAAIKKPDDSAFAAVYADFPILQIYDKNKTLSKSLWYENHQKFPFARIKKHPTHDDVGEIMLNYRQIKATDKYIYALYDGKKIKDVEGKDEFSNEIHLFDWQGTPVAKLLLNRNIFAFDVHQNDEYIIASSLYELEELYKFDFSIE